MTVKPSDDVWLVAHDMTGLGDKAAFEAARLCAATGAALHILHVHPLDALPPFATSGEDTYKQEQTIKKRLAERVSSMASKFPTLSIEFAAQGGDALERVLAEAERINATHIVVGTHDRKGVSRLFLGSVAESIVHRAQIPVMVVKGDKG
jgi:nucleotide-binding universal stress UspA family protein